jgi:chromosome segregation ATPase
MVLKILLLLIILIAAILSLFRYKTIETFYVITSEEIEKNAKEFSNVTDLYKKTLTNRDALKSNLNKLKKQAELNQQAISRNQSEPRQSDIEAATSLSEKNEITREYEKIENCKENSKRSIDDYKQTKTDYDDINKLYTKLNDDYQDTINKTNKLKKNIDSLKVKMNKCT